VRVRVVGQQGLDLARLFERRAVEKADIQVVGVGVLSRASRGSLEQLAIELELDGVARGVGRRERTGAEVDGQRQEATGLGRRTQRVRPAGVDLLALLQSDHLPRGNAR
jgi:hypothetical protein